MGIGWPFFIEIGYLNNFIDSDCFVEAASRETGAYKALLILSFPLPSFNVQDLRGIFSYSLCLTLISSSY